MGWAIIDNSSTESWYNVFQSVRIYMSIMKYAASDIYTSKIYEALTTYDDSVNKVPKRRYQIRYTFEMIELCKDYIFTRPVCALTHKTAYGI